MLPVGGCTPRNIVCAHFKGTIDVIALFFFKNRNRIKKVETDMPIIFYGSVAILVLVMIYWRWVKRVDAGHACVVKNCWSGALRVIEGPTTVVESPLFQSCVPLDTSAAFDSGECDVAKWGSDICGPNVLSHQFPVRTEVRVQHFRKTGESDMIDSYSCRVTVIIGPHMDIRDLIDAHCTMMTRLHDHLVHDVPLPEWMHVEVKPHKTTPLVAVPPTCLVCLRRLLRSHRTAEKLWVAKQAKQLRLDGATIAAMM